MIEALKTLVEPPASLFVLAAVGWILMKRYRRLGQAIVFAAALTLYALSTPLVAQALLGSLERADEAIASDPGIAEAVVILSAGLRASDIENNDRLPDALTLERLRKGAAVARETGLPVLLSGGLTRTTGSVLSEVMSKSLSGDFGIAPRWLESKSTTTAENAEFSAEILRTEGIRNVFVVTHAWHLPRARREFERHGIGVVPTPVGYELPDGRLLFYRLLPSASALARSRYAVHEYIGWVWYTISA